MSEYWKSQPKKFCEFCKVWITDNKPSVEFHERGKKHQENAKRRIIEVQKKGRDAQKANEQKKKDLEAIEAAALKAYQKDLAASKPRSEISGKSSRGDDKEHQSVSSCVIIYHGTEPVAHCTHGWSVGKSPDGHYYYYNTSTNGSQWQLPECLDKTTGETPPSSSTATTDKQQTEAKKSETKEKGERKETLTKGNTNQDETEKSESTSESKTTKPVPSGPYGQWTTVMAYSTASESTSKERPTELNAARASSVGQQNEEVEAQEEKKAAKPLFKERVAPKLNVGKGNSGEVAFKKRKLNSVKKRNIRRTEFTT